MNKKIVIMAIISFLLISGAITISNANVIKQPTISNINKITANKEVHLGWANIVGDGTEENTTIDVQAENDLIIKTDSKTSYIDFYINYSMLCDGLTDNGVITLLIQINGENRGNDSIITFTNKGDNLTIKNVEVKWGNALSFEIGAIYTNIIPPFVKPAYVLGGGLIGKKAVVNDYFNKLSMLRFLENYPFVHARLLHIVD
jgi:hypothetical protein